MSGSEAQTRQSVVLTDDEYARLSAQAGLNVKQRPGMGGRTLSYIDAREVMDRLDEVIGPNRWCDSYRQLEGPGFPVQCTLTLFAPEGDVSTFRTDVGYCNNPQSPEPEALKSAYSDAFKRAAVKFGIGRFLYQDPEPVVASQRPAPAPAPRPQQSGGSAYAQEARQAIQSAPSRPANGAPMPASEPQLKAIYAIARGNGYGDGEEHALARAKFGVTSLKELSRRQASELIDALKAGVRPGPVGEVEAVNPDDLPFDDV